jgi:hypothetical protein
MFDRADAALLMIRLSRQTTKALGWFALFGIPAVGAAQQRVPDARWVTIRGSVYDSVRHRPLAGAVVLVQGTARLGLTDDKGDYLIDSVAPGSHRLALAHALLDSIGVEVVTPAVVVRPGELLIADIATPSARQIVSGRCAPAVLAARGPAALVGRVVDAESLAPAAGIKVQLTYEESVMGFKGNVVVREALADSSGAYTICGLPSPIGGKLQALGDGIASGQIDVAVTGTLAWRSLSVSALRHAAIPVDSSGGHAVAVMGTSRLRGRVVDQAGKPIAQARVSVEGSGRVTTSSAQGAFALDSLLPGTQQLMVRKLGFAAIGKSVELTPGGATEATVVLDTYALEPMRVESTRDEALASLGYLDRKRAGFGFFLDGDKIRREAPRFSDVIRGAPMLKFSPTPGGRVVIENARDPNYGCVNYFVDGAQWKEMRPGDIDDYLMPGEIQALEVYNPSSVPARFHVGGRTSCASVIIWTTRSTNRSRGK